MDQQLICNLKEISLLVFEIRKLRFLSSTPDQIKDDINKDNFFSKIEIRLYNIDKLPYENQILLCTGRVICKQKISKGLFYKELMICYIGFNISVFCGLEHLIINLLYLFLLRNTTKFHQELEENIKDTQQENKQLNDKRILQIPFLGFSSLTRNVVYIATYTNLEVPFRKDIEAQLFEGFCYWLIRETRTPLTIISEELNIFSEQGFHIEPSDAYLEKVYNAKIQTQCPFRMFQYNAPRIM